MLFLLSQFSMLITIGQTYAFIRVTGHLLLRPESQILVDPDPAMFAARQSMRRIINYNHAI